MLIMFIVSASQLVDDQEINVYGVTYINNIVPTLKI